MNASSNIPSIDTVAMIGAGTMGRHISALTAMTGREVRLFDTNPAAVESARTEIASDILPNIIAAEMTSGDAEAAFANIHPSDSLEDAVQGADLVIEAIREDLETKRAFFGQLSMLTPVILATNSSSIQSSQIADVVTNPNRFLNMHFFQPIWLRPMLEVMSCGSTNPSIVEAVRRFGESLGLITVVVRKDSKGFVINRIWRAIKRESLRVVDEDVADPADVDLLFSSFFGIEEGPFSLMDKVGLDVVEDIETSYQSVTLDPTDTPSRVLHDKVAHGQLGVKTGSGFYEYSPNNDTGVGKD